MIELIISLWLLLVLILTFYKIKWGVTLFLAYMILVPVVHISFGGMSLGENVLNATFLLGYLIYVGRKHKKVDWRPLTPFLVYYGLTLIVMPFQDGMPITDMLNGWRVSFMNTIILPFVMWNLIKDDPSSVKWFRNSMLISIGIAVIYGLLLIALNGINPYIMLLSDMLDLKDNMEDYYVAENQGRLFGRISSVFVHPMNYALFLGLSCIYIYQSRHKINTIIVILLLTAISCSAITCGVRSVIGALAITSAYYFASSRNYKIILAAIPIVIGAYVIIGFIPGLSDYLGSMADINNTEGAVNGSSWEMRENQLLGAIDEGSKNPIFGLGYGWTGYYMNQHGEHPICLAFESLFFVIICNWALIGFLIYGIFIYLYLQINREMRVKEIYIFDCLLFFYLAYACITGEYGYMRYFVIFYILMLGNNQQLFIRSKAKRQILLRIKLLQNMIRKHNRKSVSHVTTKDK